MKVIFAVALLVLSHFELKCQINEDNFEKYSYQIFGFSLPQRRIISGVPFPLTFSGTGFFYRKRNKLFFITARHVLSGCTNNSIKFRDYPDTMFVFLSKSNPSKILTVDIKKIRDSTICLPSAIEPDVFAIQIDDTIAREVLSVEKFDLQGFKRTKNLVMAGYPGDNNVRTAYNVHYVPPSHINFPEGDYSFERIFRDSANTTIDSVDVVIASSKIPIGDSLSGYSGSPFFVQDKRTKRFRIEGVFVADINSDNRHLISIVLMSFAVDKINLLLKRM